ncbi:MAG: hypothetical protein GWN58_45065, partial [Anaerolineae bacterium]|nr:hypothetical protein [Anaerolineae bacterium]
QGVLTADRPITGTIDLTQSVGNLSLQVQDAAGQVVRTIDMGTQAAGKVPFVWDGMNQNGEPMPPGGYRVYASAVVEGEQ